jgi:hypothetical protein
MSKVEGVERRSATAPDCLASMIKIANAPCSWGALEFDLEGEAPNYVQVLNEIAETGYAGTELGDWGFMPTDPEKLSQEIRAVNDDGSARSYTANLGARQSVRPLRAQIRKPGSISVQLAPDDTLALHQGQLPNPMYRAM